MMVRMGRFARRGLRVAARAAAVFCAVMVLAASALEAQGTPAGTVIRAWAIVSFDILGVSYSFSTDTASVTVGQAAGVDVQPPRTSTGSPGAALVFAHALANMGNAPDSFTITGASKHAWPVALYLDVNGDGVLNAGDLPLSGPVSLGYAGLTHILAQLSIPNNAGALGVTDTVTLVATSHFDGTVSASVPDRADIPAAPVALAVTKQVDRASAVANDVLTYTLAYAASGGGITNSAQLADTIPVGAQYVPGTLRWNGNPLTDAADADAGSFVAAGNGVITVDLGAQAGGASGSVTFQARFTGALPVVTNGSHAIYAWSGTTDTVYSNTVQTTLLVPLLALSKQLTSPAQAQVGQQVHYTLHYGNAVGAAPIASATLVDTLPAGLTYVSASPAATPAGAVLTWALGALAAGDSGTVDLTLVVANTVRDTLWVRNVATLSGASAVTQFAAAQQIALIGPSTAALDLSLTANALEVAMGELIPYTLVVRNSGIVPVSAIKITNTLPPGGVYAKGTALGADSVTAAGAQLVLWSAAPLAPGASRTFHYAIALTSAHGTLAENRAIAAGTAGALAPVSPEAIAWVQIRRAWPMETRAAIGKVWVDATNHGGLQRSDDVGLAGIDVWTEDGQVATTDSTGKYSFSNLRPGRHVFRIDARSLPAGYHVTDDEVQTVEASGWTTPHVDFRITGAALSSAAPAGAPTLAPTAALSAAPARIPALPAAQPHDGLPPAPAVLAVSSDLRAATTASPAAPATGAVSGVSGILNVRFHATQLTDSSVMGVRHTTRYDVDVRKDPRAAMDVMLRFEPRADSALVYVDDSLFTRYTWLGDTGIPFPADAPHSRYRVVAWAAAHPDSATAILWTPWTPLHRLPIQVAVQRGSAVHAPWLAAALPNLERVAGDTTAPELELPEPRTLASPRPRVPGARGPAEHTGPLQGMSIALGPVVHIFAPEDGVVLPTDHLWVGVKGEAGASVELFDGIKRLDSGSVRVDGVHDFIAIPLSRGPHILRVEMKNSWGAVSQDSIAVHVTGLPSRFAISESRVTLPADGRTIATARVRVLDAWGVPVVQPSYVTVSATGAEPVGSDADPSSVGVQQLSDSAGWLSLNLRAGHEVRRGLVELKAGSAHGSLPLELLPEVRPITIAGSGMVGVGASPDAYGAITARGRLDERTSVTLGLDSRSINDGQNAFGRSADPLAEAQYPLLGDASQLQLHTASHSWISARVERGFDWASYGDLATTDFASGLTLSEYHRALTGFAAHVTTGPVAWTGFGTLTSQALGQMQIRGAGVSGPYQLSTSIIPGTDYLRIETRDFANPERAIATQALSRFIDYEIDYVTGTVLFKQPIPAADAQGNPLFIVATYEAASTGEQRLVAGGHAALDLGSLMNARFDSLRLGLTVVNADQAASAYRLVGGDLRAFRLGGLDLGAEVAYAAQGDSTGFGTMAKASYSVGRAFTLGAGFMHVDREFRNPSNVALQPGLTEVSVKSGLKIGASELRAEYASQDFTLQNLTREHSRIGIVQPIMRGLQLDAGVTNDQATGALVGGQGFSDVTAGNVKAQWTPVRPLQLYTEVQRNVSLSGEELTPDFWGFGGSYRLTSSVSLEAGEHFVTNANGGGDYAVSNIGVKANAGANFQAWSSYQLTGGVNGTQNAAIVGLRNQLHLTPNLALNVMFERRSGVSTAPFTDPVRALPFLQPEDDYWSGGLGLELLPADRPYRLSVRGEYKDGTLQSTRLVSVAGDVSLNRSLALLSRQQFTQNALSTAPLSRQLSSLWGLAFRPVRSDRVNMLAKLQWTDALNPLGTAVLTPQGDERKLIGAAEMIWTPTAALELTARYAVRRTEGAALYPDSTTQTLTAWADYAGGQMDIALSRWVRIRSDGRLLIQRSTGATTWDAAPALAFRPVNGLEVASGYRFGDLTDPDFSVRGGHGFFVTFTATITEKLFPTAAEFWRGRF